MQRYNPHKIESKWQREWEKKKTWKVDLRKAKKSYYNLMMFPYPSAEGLHVGNVYAFTGSDIHGRFQRMQGKDVFEPIGFDAFGIHSENFAIQQGAHPKTQTAKNIKNFRKQLKQMGALFDWDHEIITSDPSYYKWTQWLFLQLYKAGLAYRAKAPVDWCPSCKTVLADEQVINGHCERCDTTVVQKELEQWFFRITKYAEKLLKNLSWIDWSERTKIAQKNWIGKSEDTEIIFVLKESDKKVPVVTTRADTIFGATFLVLAPEHELLETLKANITNLKEVEAYIRKTKRKSEFERGLGNKEKTGVQLKGITGINPVNKRGIPVYIADYVLVTYGTGAIMAVPAHDDRDFIFAKKFNIPIVYVIEEPRMAGIIRAHVYDNDISQAAQKLRDLGKPMEYWTPTQRRYDVRLKDKTKLIQILKEARIGTKKQYERIKQGGSFALEMKPSRIDFGTVYSGDGIHINSDFLDGLHMEEAIKKMTMWLKEHKLGGKSVHYHLRDWLISRQRYWGPPIPIIYCEECGIVPVPEKDLPVLLPNIKNFRPTGTSKSPLASVERFVNTKCPQCKKPAKRETDVSDTFLDSAWYFLRYPSTDFSDKPLDKVLTKKWLPIDMYIGGQEHAVLHLMYTRFTTMVLNDLGYIDFAEPFTKFRAHGLVIKDGAKMSKSRGNVVNPDEYFTKYGADTVRMYLMFIGPFTEGGDWNDKSIIGISRYLNRLWNLCCRELKDEIGLEFLRQKTVRKVTEDMEELKYNTAIAALMEYTNEIQKIDAPAKIDVKTLLILLASFAPHITEELWKNLGHKASIHNQPWPTYSTKLAKEARIRLVLQVNGKVRDVTEVVSSISEKEAKKLALESEKVQKWVKGKKPKRIIIVPKKLVNIVI